MKHRALLKCYVWSTLSYGCESWTLSKRMESQLDWKPGKWFLRRMLRIAWTDKVSSDQVLQKANTSRNLLKVIFQQANPTCGSCYEKESVGSRCTDQDD